MGKLICFTFVLCAVLPYLLASAGDRSLVYQNCVDNCLNTNCTDDGSDFKPTSTPKQDPWDRFLLWNCRDECRYHCMWRTVDEFKKLGHSMPKFHGKWPFERMLGVQEPEAVLASLLNLIANYHMYEQIRTRWSGRDVPLVTFWQGFAVVSMNTWLWSAVFHTRDTYFTEFMDYAGAMLLVLAFFVAAVVRIFYKWSLLSVSVSVLVFMFYVEHCRYLYTGKIDYDYNMTVNVFFGLIGSTLWAVWSFYHLMCGRRYVVRMVAFTTLSGAALGLELFDFPPIVMGWDSHALWHLATAPLPLLLCEFVMEDLKHLQLQRDATTKLA